MKNLTIFLCNVEKNCDLKNNSSNRINFLKNLETIRKNNGSDLIILSFISCEYKDYIIELENEFKKLADDKTLLGIHFCFDDCIYNNKALKVKKYKKINELLIYINQLLRQYKVNNVYFIDNSYEQFNFIYEIQSLINQNVKLSFVMANDNVNEAVEKQITKNKMLTRNI